MTEHIAFPAADLPVGSMKDFKVPNGGPSLLLYNVAGKGFRATGAKCTHYAAPLAKGTFTGERIMCPWHGACWNVCTGDIEDAPGLDGIPTFAVRENDDGMLVVTVPENVGKAWKRPMKMCARDPAATKTFVIVGGGAAGAVAAETLRHEGFDGRIVMVCRESSLPYDRPKCSKSFTTDVSTIQLRTADFYEQNGIEVQLATTVTAIDTAAKSVTLSSGSSLAYDGILVCTGGDPRPLPSFITGQELGNIFSLRTAADSAAIGEAVVGKSAHCVIVGSSFIGMEMAAAMRRHCESVTVVGMEAEPFERVLGADVGRAMRLIHEEKGVQFQLRHTVKAFVARSDDPSTVGTVVLDNDEQLTADIVVVGAGVAPATGFLRDSGVDLHERDGSVLCSGSLQSVSEPSVYAAGDVACFHHEALGRPVRIEHWNVAQQQARTAVRHFLGLPSATFDTVPMFWTAQYGLSVRYCGLAADGFDRVAFACDSEPRKFVAYYVKDERVVAVASLGRDPAVTNAAEEFRTTGAVELPSDTKPSLF